MRVAFGAQLVLLAAALSACRPSRDAAPGDTNSKGTGEGAHGTAAAREVIALRRGIEQWEAATNIGVSEAAINAMERDWRILETKIDEPAVSFLASAYLYEVRDVRELGKRGAAVVSVDDVTSVSLYTFTTMSGYGRDVGYLRCVSVPEGGAIMIDGTEKGVTIKEFALSVGVHKVEIAIQGKRCEEQVKIESGRSKEARCQ